MAHDTELLPFDVNLEGLQTFLAITELGSFSRAAKLLNIAQPSISNRIQRLERKLGTRLLERTTRKVELTPEGQLLYLQSSNAFSGLRTMLRAFADEAQDRVQEVHVAATISVASLALPHLIRQFQEDHPDIEVIVHDLFSREVIAMVQAGNCDLAVLPLSDPVEDVHFDPLFYDPCFVITRRDHPLLHDGVAPLEKALAEPLLHPNTSDYLTAAIFAEAKRQHISVQQAPAVQGVRNPVTSLAMAAAGLGVAIGTRYLIPPELVPVVGVVPLCEPQIMCTVGLVTSKERELSGAAQEFCAFMRTVVQPGPHPWHPRAV